MSADVYSIVSLELVTESSEADIFVKATKRCDMWAWRQI